jgi:23S rRNA pseudouridine2605 synthase
MRLEPMRLAKYLAHAGVASRRAAESIVRAGRVTVDGETVTDPARQIRPGTVVTLDGAPVDPGEERVVYALNKPAGVVSTASDPQGRPTVVSLIAGDMRLYPVGRLDIDATGLLLLTNDGELANRLTHPRYEVPKTYRVVVGRAPVRERAVRELRHGVQLDDGPTAPARVRRVAPGILELTIHEGRKRQVKRMCEHVGHPVLQLQRTAIGPLALGNLALGTHRRLTNAEIEELQAASAGTEGRRAGARSP